MLRITFVSPPLGLKERYGGFAPLGSTMPSMALLSLASVARKAGFESYVIPADSLNLDYNEIINRVSNLSSNCLAITSTTFSIHQAHRLATLAKKKDNKIVTLIGGPHISALPKETMEMFPNFDIGVLNEGEVTLIELLGALNEKKSIDQIKGIVFRKEELVVFNEARPLIRNLNDLPYPAWDLLEGFPNLYYPPLFRFRKLPAATILTSRGCPHQCIFCSKAVFGNHIRLFSAEYVFGMMELLHKKYGVKEILIEDDTFLVVQDRVRAICDLILKNNLDISWSCLARVDNIEEDLSRFMKRTGCWQIGFGIESGSQDVLDFAKKGINLDIIRKALEITKKVGILSKGFFILGFPNDSIDTIKSTINFAKKSSLSDISVSFMTPLPGTELYEKASEFGEFDNDWKKMNLLEIVFLPKGLHKEDLKKYSRILIRKFYLRPQIIFSYFLRIIQSPIYYGRMLKGFFGFLKNVF